MIAEQSAEARKPHIAVAYYAPVFGADKNGEEVVYVLKQLTWSVNLKNKDHFYLCSFKPDGSAHREVCCLDQRDGRQFWDLLRSPFDHMEIRQSANLGVLGSEWYPGTEHILLFSLDGATIRRLSPSAWQQQGRPPRVGYPTLSPDGGWITFVEETCRDGLGGARYCRLAKCRPDGSDYAVLTKFDGYRNDTQPEWSPDGVSIAYMHIDNRELRVMDVDGNIKWTLSSQFGFDSPRWSPDGKLILLGGEMLVDVSSRKETNRIQPPLPRWSKWGKSGYLISQKDGIDFVEPDARTVHRLVQNVSRPAKYADIKKEEFRW